MPEPSYGTLKPIALWRAFKAETAAFWSLCVYLVFEYLHPQITFRVIDFMPWGVVTLVAATVAFLLSNGKFKLPTIIGKLLMVFMCIVLASSAAAIWPSESMAKLSRFLTWVVVYVLITNVVVTERRFALFTFLFLLCSFKMSQFGAKTWALRGFTFADWGVTGSPVWFQNSGEFGIQMCVVFPISIAVFQAYRSQWSKWTKALFLLAPITMGMSMVASSSRGALVGGGLVLAWLLVKSKHVVRSTIITVVIVTVAIVVTPPEQKARFGTMGDDDTSVHRLTMWKDGIQIAKEHPLLGIGYNNWHEYYKDFFSHGLPHNIFIEAVSELGFPGLLCFLALIIATFTVNRKTRKLAQRLDGVREPIYQLSHGLDGALIGFVGSGFFVTVLYYPFFWINLAMTVALHRAMLNKLRTSTASSKDPQSARIRGNGAMRAPAVRGYSLPSAST